MKRGLLVVLCWGLLAASAAAEDLPGAVLVSVYDGDTLTVTLPTLPRVFGSHLRVRLAGIDAPELLGACAQERTLARAARDFLVAHVTPTLLLTHVTRDKYFRITSVVLAGGVNLNALLLQHGYAVPYSGHGPKHAWCTLAP